MSRIQVDNIFDKEGSGAPSLPAGVVVAGVSTFSNNISVPGNTDIIMGGAADDTTGALKIYNNSDRFFEIFSSSKEAYIRNTGSDANGININANDSVTLGGGGSSSFSVQADSDGKAKLSVNAVEKLRTDAAGVIITGVCSATSFIGSLQVTNADFSGLLREGVKVTAGKLSDNTNINLDNGMAHLFTTTETTTATPNIMSATGINTDVQVGEAFSVSIIVSAAAAGYAATVHIDGVSIGAGGGSLVWNGGEAPSAGGSSGKDYYTYNIIKTASSTYTVLGNVANFA